jgi:hypothetical protein
MKKFYQGSLSLGIVGAVAAMLLSQSVARAVEKFTPADNVSETKTDTHDPAVQSNPFSIYYTNIFYGPSISNPSSYQPASDGTPDRDRPIFTKNFLSAGYSFNESVALTGMAYWQYRPVLGQQFTMMDPSVRISHSSIVSTSWGLNLYGDARAHFGVTDASRQADMIGAFENFNYLTWEVNHSRFLAALRVKERYNIYGRHGVGSDVEFYLAPEAQYRLSSKVALTLLYEMGASHNYGDQVSYFTNDGTDLEPGVSWDVLPSLNLNPYLNINTGGKITAASTSVGMFLNWAVL